MSKKARRQRKRAGFKRSRPARSSVRAARVQGLGLTSGAEIMAGIVIRGAA